MDVEHGTRQMSGQKMVGRDKDKNEKPAQIQMNSNVLERRDFQDTANVIEAGQTIVRNDERIQCSETTQVFDSLDKVLLHVQRVQ